MVGEKARHGSARLLAQGRNGACFAVHSLHKNAIDPLKSRPVKHFSILVAGAVDDGATLGVLVEPIRDGNFPCVEDSLAIKALPDVEAVGEYSVAWAQDTVQARHDAQALLGHVRVGP